MSQSHLILRNTVALAAARVTEKGANAALGLLVARYLGASALGVYSAALVVLTVVTLTSEMGSTTFLVREIARDRKVSGTYLVHFGALTILLSLIAMAAALLLVPHLDYSPQLTACVYVIVFATIPAVLRTMQEAVFVAHQRASFIVWSTAVGAVINLVAGFVLLRRGSGIVAIIAVFVAVQYIMSFFYLGLLNRYVCRLRMSFDFRVAWALIREVRAFAGSSILGGVLARPEVIILALSRNDTQLGYYVAALRVVELWGVVAETYMRNVLPVLSHAYIFERSRCQGLLAQSVKLLLAVSLPLAFGIFVIARPLVALLYGPGFEPAAAVLRVLAWGIPLAFLFELLWRLLAARDQQHLMLRAQIIMIGVRLVGGYLLIASLASVGAAFSSVVFTGLHISILIWYAGRDGTRIHLFRTGWRLALAALGMAAAASALLSHSQLWLVAIAAAGIYAVILVLLKALSPADFALLRRTPQARTSA